MVRCGYAVLAAVLVVLAGCEPTTPTPGPGKGPGAGTPSFTTFGNDLEFLKKHGDVILLAKGDAQVAVMAKYQGRVMTSTAEGEAGMSFGWINRELIASGKTLPQFNPVGGEERFWIGPEGGQFGLFFPKGASDKFDFKDWKTPACIDTDAWDVVETTETSASFRKTIKLANFSGTEFDLVADRSVRLLTPAEIKKRFPGILIPADVKSMAFETDNAIKNTGQKAWTKETGLLSIWILCMFTPSPSTTAVLPYTAGDEAALGPIVTPYPGFGEIPPERLKAKDGVVFFMCDGKRRGKIGLRPQRAKGVAGSYDAANRVLTLATYTTHEGVTDYVNSTWAIQKEPYAGDAVNSYNDGPVDGGKPLGPFYEIESSSPAAALKPGETLRHVHTTLHLAGPEGELQLLAKAVLGVGVDEIINALPKPKAAE